MYLDIWVRNLSKSLLILFIIWYGKTRTNHYRYNNFKRVIRQVEFSICSGMSGYTCRQNETDYNQYWTFSVLFPATAQYIRMLITMLMVFDSMYFFRHSFSTK